MSRFLSKPWCQDWNSKCGRPAFGTPNAVTLNGSGTYMNLRPLPHTKIATCCNGCPFRLIHTLFLFQLIRRALTQTPTAIRCYVLRLPQPSRLHCSLHCYSVSCISAYMTIIQLISQLIRLFVSIRLTQLRTQAYALAYTQSRSSNSSSSASPHVLGLNAYGPSAIPLR